jgi:hypothetical protein
MAGIWIEGSYPLRSRTHQMQAPFHITDAPLIGDRRYCSVLQSLAVIDVGMSCAEVTVARALIEEVGAIGDGDVTGAEIPGEAGQDGAGEVEHGRAAKPSTVAAVPV